MNEFEKAKMQIEAEEGRPLSPDEGVIVKGLFDYGKGMQFKNQLESEPQKRKERVVAAIKGYIENKFHKPNRQKKRKGKLLF